jgi:hypothetical protein
MIIKSMIDKYKDLNPEEIKFAKKFIKDRQLNIPNDCDVCYGKGFYWVCIGEEGEKEPCDNCDYIDAHFGVEYARFLKQAWKDLRKSVRVKKIRSKIKQVATKR